MKTTYAVIFSVLLLLLSACAQKLDDPADVQAVKKSVEDFVKAFNAGDADGIAALMTDKVAFADLNVPVAVGKDAVQSQFRAAFEQFKGDLSSPVEDVRVTGALAVARGTFTNKVTPKAEGVAPTAFSGSWMATFARQNGGSWKWDSLVANSDQPAPGSTASGDDEKALYQIERDWAVANLKREPSAVEKFLADEFVSIFEGRTANKKQSLAEIKNNPAKIESAANSDMTAMVFGDTAMVRGRFTEKSTTGGKDTGGQFSWTDVFVKRDGRWQCVTSYATKVQ